MIEPSLAKYIRFAIYDNNLLNIIENAIEKGIKHPPRIHKISLRSIDLQRTTPRHLEPQQLRIDEQSYLP